MSENKEVQLPMRPQEIALQCYIDMVKDAAEEGETTAEKMRDIMLVTIECAVRAQRMADTVLLEVLGERSPDIDYRRVCSELAEIFKGERKAEILPEDQTPLIVVPR